MSNSKTAAAKTFTYSGMTGTIEGNRWVSDCGDYRVKVVLTEAGPCTRHPHTGAADTPLGRAA